MEIVVNRIRNGGESCYGEIFVNGAFYGFTLEDVYRGGLKIPGKTGIPPGRYQIKPRTEGELHKKYCASFSWHRSMLWLQDVKNYTWIYMHPGNRHTHTKGCILVGSGSKYDYADNEFELVESLKVYKMIALLCYEAWDNDEDVFITINGAEDV